MKSPDQAAFKTILIIVVLFAIVMLPHVAKAQPNSPGGPPSFEDFDRNGDGFVSAEEFNSTRAERMAERAEEGRPMKGAAGAPAFSDFDGNGDGQLDPAEFAAGQDAHRHMRHAEHMADGRGMQHGKGMPMPEFGDLDLNGDGCIDADEFAKHQAEHHGKKQEEE